MRIILKAHYILIFTNGTTTPIEICPREVKLTIGEEVIDDVIVNSAFKKDFTSPSKEYGIIVNVDNQTFIISFNTKADPNFKVNIENITYGNDLVIDSTIDKEITGNVTITIGNKNYTATINDGKIHYSIPDLGAGDYKVTVKYNGSDDYNPAEFNKTINVAQVKANLAVNIANVSYGEASIVTVKLTGVKNTKLNGTVVVTINNQEYKVNVKNGVGTLNEVKLPVNTYELSATWEGNNNYTKTITSGGFEVSKPNLNMTVKADSIEAGQNATIIITGLANATGNVTIKVDNKTYDVKIVNGTVTKNITGLKEGNYTVDVIYAGDDNYNSDSASTNFTVGKLDSTIDFKVDNNYLW